MHQLVVVLVLDMVGALSPERELGEEDHMHQKFDQEEDVEDHYGPFDID